MQKKQKARNQKKHPTNNPPFFNKDTSPSTSTNVRKGVLSGGIPTARNKVSTGGRINERQDPSKIKTKIISFYLFIFILSLPTQLGKHFFLPFSFLSGVRIDYLAPTLYLTDILAFFLIILNIKTLFSLKNRSILLIIALFILNIFFSLSPYVTIYKIIKLIEITALFIIFSKNYLSEKLTLIALALGGLIEFILVVLQFVNKQSVQGVFYYLGERYMNLATLDIAKASLKGIEILRPYGTFSHPNSMAGFYLLIYFFVLTNEKFSKYLFLKYLVLFLASILVFFSFSKIAIGVYVLLNIYFLIKSKFFKRCLFCFSARVIILLVLAAIFISAQGDQASLEKRILLFKDSLTIIVQHPFFGVGLGNYLVAQHQFTIKYPYFFLQPVHNIFTLFFAETGLILGGFLVYKLLPFVRKNIRKDHFLLPFLVVVLTGLFDHYWLTLQQNLLLISVVFGVITAKNHLNS